MAHTKAQGAVKGNRDSISKRLGIKLFGGQKAGIGAIIARQKGTKVKAGFGVGMGKDHTLFALSDGVVRFRTKLGKKFVDVVALNAS